MRTCSTCRFLVYPTAVGYACKKRKLWGTNIPLFFDSPYECKKWKVKLGRDDANKIHIPVDVWNTPFLVDI